MAGASGDGVGLALVAGQQLVGEGDHVGADRRAEDRRVGEARGIGGHVALQGLHGDEGAADGDHGGGGGGGGESKRCRPRGQRHSICRGRRRGHYLGTRGRCSRCGSTATATTA